MMIRYSEEAIWAGAHSLYPGGMEEKYAIYLVIALLTLEGD
jgi:hypothetical protein